NQKLISTALAVDRLGVNHRLKTSLWRLPNGTLRLEGEGDPGFSPQQVARMAAALSGHGVHTGTVSMEFEELVPRHWWPADWHSADRNWSYGAPVTRLAVSANSSGDYAVYDPPKRLAGIWSQVLNRQGYGFEWAEVPADSPNPQGSQLIHEELSQPLQSLMSRANTDSHNNTAEVLLRVGSGTWNLAQASQVTLQWLKDKNLPVDGVTIADGSGLSRSNRSTTRLYTSLLLTMQYHANGSEWYGTMAVANRTGTLERFSSSPSLTGKFVGKTGTIRGVKALSGRMATPHGYRFFSMLANGSAEPRSRMVGILEAVLKHSSCPRVF
ncbi:MAG: D-alanyl-D-alanine carboxypeptidase, partial [Synechococcus sp. SB0669_bin_8]|nr:D-alanyl-D-alanine carboxypeptidase [Synechococcus sp. SB0672_bin_6]MYK92104.1 D-alanyl-D-alanine carboxypeptidase [Synechococcus sp. SB0669_bin_8]